MILIELVLLYFICVKIGKIAIEKNRSVLRWRIYAVLAWFFFEGIGANIAIAWLGIKLPTNMEDATKVLMQHPGVSFFGIFCAFGGYLLVRSLLERKQAANK